MNAVAIVGLDGKFPSASSPGELWLLLREGRCGIRPQNRWDPGFMYPDLAHPRTMVTDQLGSIDGIEFFDNSFFGFSPKEAESTDPRLRLLLEVAWRSMEHGCQRHSKLSSKSVGLWVGAGPSDYRALLWREGRALSAWGVAGTERSSLAHTLSRRLDFKGPSVVVDAGCSSIPVAIDEACRTLNSGEVDIALVGAANLILDPFGSIALAQSWMLSEKGESRPFDSSADGYVRSECVGMIVLRRLADALNEGDPILATIEATGICHAGRGPISVAMVEAMRKALSTSGLSQDDIAYVEAHAVGALGSDAIELVALSEVFKHVRIGSCKANVGHSEWAGGLVSIVKLCSIFSHHELPAQIHCENPVAELDPRVFATNRSLLPFDGRFALLNTLSLGGLASTVILQAPPTSSSRTSTEYAPHLVALSAPDRPRLEQLARAWATSGIASADAAWTLATRREHFAVRAACVVADLTRLTAKLNPVAKSVGFAFSGQGSQRHAMGVELAKKCRTFAESLEEVDGALRPHMGISLYDLLCHARIDDTDIAQPALFALQCALAKTWVKWGVAPAFVIGHSVGELAACVTAGIITLEEAAEFVVARGKLMGELPSNGGMLATFAPLDDIQALLKRYAPQLVVAASNTATMTVVAGTSDSIERFAECLDNHCIRVLPLNVSHAFHSPLMAPALPELARAAAKLNVREGRIPLMSTVLARPLLSLPLDYWTRHAEQMVRFGPVIRSLESGTFLIEMGPEPALTRLGNLDRKDITWLASLSKGREWTTMLDAAASLWAGGITLDLADVERAGDGAAVHGPCTSFAQTPYLLQSSLPASSV